MGNKSIRMMHAGQGISANAKKRYILSSLVFSLVSMPGNAAATRRNS